MLRYRYVSWLVSFAKIRPVGPKMIKINSGMLTSDEIIIRSTRDYRPISTKIGNFYWNSSVSNFSSCCVLSDECLRARLKERNGAAAGGQTIDSCPWTSHPPDVGSLFWHLHLDSPLCKGLVPQGASIGRHSMPCPRDPLHETVPFDGRQESLLAPYLSRYASG